MASQLTRFMYPFYRAAKQEQAALRKTGDLTKLPALAEVLRAAIKAEWTEIND